MTSADARPPVVDAHPLRQRSMQAFGGSTFSFMWQEPALSAMRKMHALGFNDFDIIMVPGHFWHDELSSSARSDLLHALREDGIRIESLNLPALDQNLASCVAEVRASAVEMYSHVLRLSSEIGAKGVVAVPGRVSALWPPAQSDSEAWLADSLSTLLRLCEHLDQTIHIESHPQTPIPTVDKLEAFLARLEHRRLKVAYDVSNAEFVSEDQVDALKRLAPRLGQLHLSDGTRTRWRHDRVGVGSVDFKGIMGVVAELDFKGVAILEIVSPGVLDDMVSSRSALDEILRQAAGRSR